MSVRIILYPHAIDAIKSSEEMAAELGRRAKSIRRRAEALLPLGAPPHTGRDSNGGATRDARGRFVSHAKHLEFADRSGVSAKGAYAQVRMFDRAHPAGALMTEFGSRNNAPLAPLRRAIAEERSS